MFRVSRIITLYIIIQFNFQPKTEMLLFDRVEYKNQRFVKKWTSHPQ